MGMASAPWRGSETVQRGCTRRAGHRGRQAEALRGIGTRLRKMEWARVEARGKAARAARRFRWAQREARRAVAVLAAVLVAAGRVRGGTAVGVPPGGSTTGPAAAGGMIAEGGGPGSGRLAAKGGATGGGGSVGTGGSTEIGGTGGGVRGRGGATGAGCRTGSGGAIGTGGNTDCELGPFQTPELLTGLGLEGYDLWGPALSADGLTLYFAASNNVMADDIYVATRTARGVHFSTAVALEGVNTNSADGSPSISRDGLTLYFYSTRLGGFGGRDLWTATRSRTQEAFGSARLLANVNGGEDDNLQWVSDDELTMVFSSGRGGESDLYVARRGSREEDFSHPNSLGGVNGMTTREDRAAISNDGFTIYFTSDRAGGQGDKDIWVGTRMDVRGNFGDFDDLQAVNGPHRDIDVFLSADETELFIASNRGGRFLLYRSLLNCQ